MNANYLLHATKLQIQHVIFLRRGFIAFCTVSHKGWAIVLLMAGRGGEDIDKKKN